MNPLFAFLHHAAAFVLFSSLFAQLMLLKQDMTQQLARSLMRADMIYGISAGVVLVMGLVRVHFTEKGAAYYLHSAPFIVKLALFVIVGLISIRPTRTFLKFRESLRQQQTPVLAAGQLRSIKRTVHVELTLLVVMILCAVLMARGIGYFG